MKPKLVAAFLAIVIIPIVAVAWLGVKVARDEEAMVRQRFDAFVRERLDDIDAQVVRVLERWERDVSGIADLKVLDTESLREAQRGRRGVRQLFVIGADNKVIHPPEEARRSAAEQEFFTRTASIWASKVAFRHDADAGGGKGRGPADSGWYSWYWGSGINLIWWHRDGQGRTIGAEVDSILLLSDVVGELPATVATDGGDAGARISLLDGNGQPVYAWGTFEPAEGAPPARTRELSPPLGSMKLAYFPAGDGGAAFKGSLVISMIAGFAALLLVLIGLGGWFLWESGREMRDARQRVSFVNEVSHELKTPLTNIRMYAELLEDRLDEEDGAQRGWVRVIVSESQRLSRLIGNVLSFARQGRGKLVVRPAPASVDAVVGDVISQFGPSLGTRGVRVDFRGGVPGEVMVDADALGQILGNLLSNVEKYAASGGIAEVTTRRDGDRTVIEVADRGPGIPREARRKVFDPFFRVSQRVTDGVTGTGIGLTIARELARLHRGDLTVEPSEAGARFRVVLSTPECGVKSG